METKAIVKQLAMVFNDQALNTNIDIQTWANTVNRTATMLRDNKIDFNNAQFLNDCGWRLVFGIDAQ